jgi:hypothetical protein
MASKNKNGEWICSYCEKVYVHPQDADVCRESHDLILVQLTKEELNRIVQFLFTKDDDLLSEQLVKRLQKYLKNRAI